MTKPLAALRTRGLPVDHPFNRTHGKSVDEITADIMEYHRGRSGLVMKLVGGVEVDDDDPRPADPDPADGSLADDEVIKIDGRDWKIGDLKRIAATEKRQGKAAGQREVLEALGVTDIEAAKGMIAAAKKAQQADETEAQTKAREAEESRRGADNEKLQAAAERRTASLERALVRRGVDDADLDDAVSLLDKAVPAGGDADAIASAADALKERRTELFGGTTKQDTRVPAGSTPPGRPPARNQPKGNQFGAGGLARAERRWGKNEA